MTEWSVTVWSASFRGNEAETVVVEADSRGEAIYRAWAVVMTGDADETDFDLPLDGQVISAVAKTE